jgi:hypothetical protein
MIKTLVPGLTALTRSSAIIVLALAAQACGGSPDLEQGSAAVRSADHGHGGCVSTSTAPPAMSGHKTTICHIPPGNPANEHTITVGNPAVPAHLAHGDYIGPCRCADAGSGGGASPDAAPSTPPDAGSSPSPDAGPSPSSDAQTLT